MPLATVGLLVDGDSVATAGMVDRVCGIAGPIGIDIVAGGVGHIKCPGGRILAGTSRMILINQRPDPLLSVNQRPDPLLSLFFKI